MLILRLILMLAGLSILLCGGMYLFTRNRRYLRIAWQIVYLVIFVLLVFGLLFLLGSMY